jgi:Zn-finger nucleic acid-binding protein
MSIKCPKCNTATTIFNLEADLNFDRCDKCKGMWMDKGELARTSGCTNDFTDPKTITSGLSSTRKCPKCPGSPQMIEVFFKKPNKLMIDVCKSCEGIWLDSKELPQLQGILRQQRIDDKKKKLAGH